MHRYQTSSLALAAVTAISGELARPSPRPPTAAPGAHVAQLPQCKPTTDSKKKDLTWPTYHQLQRSYHTIREPWYGLTEGWGVREEGGLMRAVGGRWMRGGIVVKEKG